jgi:hypothetical protein
MKNNEKKRKNEDDEMLNDIARKVEKKLIDHMRNRSQENITAISEEEIKVDI